MCEASRNSTNMPSCLQSPSMSPHSRTSIPVIPPAAPPSLSSHPPYLHPCHPDRSEAEWRGIFSLPSKHRLPDPSTTLGMTDRYIIPPHRSSFMSSCPKRSGEILVSCILPTAVDPSIPLRFSRDDTVFWGYCTRDDRPLCHNSGSPPSMSSHPPHLHPCHHTRCPHPCHPDRSEAEWRDLHTSKDAPNCQDPSTTLGMTDRYIISPAASRLCHPARSGVEKSWSPASYQLRKIPPFRFASVGMTPSFLRVLRSG